MSSVKGRVVLYSAVELLVGFIFWVWAIINAASSGFDSGVIVFLFAIAAGASGMWATKKSTQPSSKLLNFHMLTLLLAHVFITLAYIGGAALAHTIDKGTGFVVYCAVFAAIWGISAFPVLKTASKYRESQLENILPSNQPSHVVQT